MSTNQGMDDWRGFIIQTQALGKGIFTSLTKFVSFLLPLPTTHTHTPSHNSNICVKRMVFKPSTLLAVKMCAVPNKP